MVCTWALLIGDAARYVARGRCRHQPVRTPWSSQPAHRFAETGRVEPRAPAFQKLREPAVRKIQKFQAFLQERIAGKALQPDAPFKIPLLLRVISYVPILRNLPVKMIAFGPRHVRIKE